MEIYRLDGTLIEAEQLENDSCPAVILTSSSDAAAALKLSGMEHDGDFSLDSIAFSKIETQNDYLFGTLCIPRLLDIASSRYRIMLFISRRNIVIVDDCSFSKNIFRKLKSGSGNQRMTVQRVICCFFSQIMQRDTELLMQNEQKIMKLEEKISDGRTDGFFLEAE